jgi:hypothetical protein
MRVYFFVSIELRPLTNWRTGGELTLVKKNRENLVKHNFVVRSIRSTETETKNPEEPRQAKNEKDEKKVHS